MTAEEEKVYFKARAYVDRDVPKFEREVNVERLKCFTDGYNMALSEHSALKEQDTRTVYYKGYLVTIKIDRNTIPLGATALHRNDSYRNKYYDNDHFVICNEGNQFSIEEHWREVISIVPVKK